MGTKHLSVGRVKFKTDRLKEVINLHKVRYNPNVEAWHDSKIYWNDNAKQVGCKAVLKPKDQENLRFVLVIFTAGTPSIPNSTSQRTSRNTYTKNE